MSYSSLTLSLKLDDSFSTLIKEEKVEKAEKWEKWHQPRVYGPFEYVRTPDLSSHAMSQGLCPAYDREMLRNSICRPFSSSQKGVFGVILDESREMLNVFDFFSTFFLSMHVKAPVHVFKSFVFECDISKWGRSVYLSLADKLWSRNYHYQLVDAHALLDQQISL